MPLPAGLEPDGSGPPELALSPDGRTIAFLAREGVSAQRLYVRRLDEDESTLVTQAIAAVDDYYGGYWSDHGSIVFVGSQPRGTYTVKRLARGR